MAVEDDQVSAAEAWSIYQHNVLESSELILQW